MPLDPHLQYGALGLLAVVVAHGMYIAWSLSRALISRLSAFTAGMIGLKESLAMTLAMLESMHHDLIDAIGEARASVLEVEKNLRTCRCRYRSETEFSK